MRFYKKLNHVSIGENMNSDILGFGGRGGKSSTVTTTHGTASQN